MLGSIFSQVIPAFRPATSMVTSIRSMSYKMKTHSGSKKRWIPAGGKFKRMNCRSTNLTMSYANKAQKNALKRLMPYASS
ncbi:uncharacterized protein VTP21DRAFT_9969 [Calcarisporiella thermophila]|uniref:uncharacterized protein n=1 Tax=Calcarisporiella thermophila TaxID=911321 RepID=UPI003742E556